MENLETMPAKEEIKSLGEDEREELRQLRIRQYNANAQDREGFTDLDRERLLALQEIEERERSAPLSDDEVEELRELQREQTASTNWTPEKANRFLKLSRREGNK